MGRVSMPQGKGSLLHNRREYEKIGRPIPDHIDVNRSHDNVTLVDMNARQAYKEIFGEALKEYNDKQKRADRRIEDYYDHIQKSKNGEKLFYEDVVQWGAKEDFADPETRQKAKEALIEYVRSFESRNLNLKIIGAYVHMDEASPHLHIDYVPVATGYSRGLSLRNSLDRAMKELGFAPEKESRKNNATKLWKENERAVFGEICRSKGLEVEAERKARGSLSVEEYKEARDAMLGEIEQEYNEKKSQIEFLDEVASYVAVNGEKAIKAEDMTIPAKKTILGKIEAPERVGTFVDNMSADQVNALIQRAAANEKLEDVVQRAQDSSSDLIAAAKKEAADIKETATAERNKTVANAENIIMQRDSILSAARTWADNLKKKCQEIAEKVKQLLGRKEALEAEVSKLEAQTKRLEPLRAEVQDLTRAKDILTGAVENEINQSKFYEPTGGFGSPDYDEKWARLKRGELLALYKDGTIRTVNQNDRGGFDYKTLDDEQAGLCRIGWFTTEETVRVPRSVLKELIEAKDDSKPISQNLENMIEQQQTVDRAVNKINRGRNR